jgi:hypothetical protein
METTLGKEYPAPRRAAYLRDNCDQEEERGYMKKFTPEQSQGHKEELADLSIKIEEKEDEKKGVMADFKRELAELTGARKRMIANIREGGVYVRETCYKFVDQEAKEVYYYNSEGDLVSQRRANADELQLSIFPRKTGSE